MAEGCDFSRSIDIGSEVLYDFSCTPCANNNINDKAERYCVECREYFCVRCFKDHNKFAIMQNHQILDKAGMSALGPQQTSMVLTEKCQVHHGNATDTYCPVHQVVGCGTCIALHHGSCKVVAYIPKVAQGFKKSTEYQDIKPAIKSSIQQLKVFKTTVQTDLKDLHTEKDVAIKDIKDYREYIEMELDRMEKKITDEVHAKYKILHTDVTANLKSIEDMMSKLESSLNNLESIKRENESDIFIYVKDGIKQITESDRLLQTLNEISGRRILQFKQNFAIDECMMKNEKLGELVIHKLCSTSLKGEYNVKVKTDTKTCDIRGCTFLDDVTLLITDFENRKIKRLSSSFQVTDYCDLPGEPTGLCVTDNKEVCVALPYEKTVQFVSVGKRLKLSRSFTTIERCYGLADSNKNIIVSNLKDNDVHIYSANGKCLRTIRVVESDCNFPFIALSTDHLKLYISCTVGVITLNMKDGQNNAEWNNNLRFLLGLCVLDNDNLLGADMGTNEVVEIKGDGLILGVILQEKDGLEKPSSVCVDKANSRLIVTSTENDKIQVFKMN